MPAGPAPHRLPVPDGGGPRSSDVPFIAVGLPGAADLADPADVPVPADPADVPGPAGPAIPAIPVSAGAMIFDRAGRLLILKPTYKSGWTIPGGVMEADGETPWDACRREAREECGLEVLAGRLACVDFRPPRAARPAVPGKSGKPGKPAKAANPGGIRYLFDCGRLDDASLAAVVLQPEEISEHRLARPAVALKMLRKPIRRRVAAALRGRAACYLENGRPVPGIGR
jgi:8-oxo-dGTP diphosphatase